MMPQGLWTAHYGQHGPEILHIWFDKTLQSHNGAPVFDTPKARPRLVGCKVTGDPNVPATQWSFVAQVPLLSPLVHVFLHTNMHGHAAAAAAAAAAAHIVHLLASSAASHGADGHVPFICTHTIHAFTLGNMAARLESWCLRLPNCVKEQVAGSEGVSLSGPWASACRHADMLTSTIRSFRNMRSRQRC